MKNTKKVMAILLAVVLLVGVVIGGTLAWFTDKTQKVENTFTVGNIDIELDEDDNTKDDGTRTEVGNDYKMIPGWTIEKDPLVTVKANSEKCYVFVKLEENGGNVTIDDKTYSFKDFLSYAMAEGWTELKKDKDGNDLTGVYYQIAESKDSDQEFKVIAGDEVTVLTSVTKGMMDALTTRDLYPKLDITAYAVQFNDSNNSNFEPAEAWAIANT